MAGVDPIGFRCGNSSAAACIGAIDAYRRLAEAADNPLDLVVTMGAWRAIPPVTRRRYQQKWNVLDTNFVLVAWYGREVLWFHLGMMLGSVFDQRLYTRSFGDFVSGMSSGVFPMTLSLTRFERRVISPLVWCSH